MSPAQFKASNTIPAVIAPSPMTAMWLLPFFPKVFAATAMPKIAEIEVEE